MSALIFADWYGPSPDTMIWSAPSGGMVSVSDVAALKDPVLAKPATISYSGLPASSGRYGPIRARVDAPSALGWTGNAIVLCACTIPSAARIEIDSWLINPSTHVLAAENVGASRPGMARHVVVYAPSRALAEGGTGVVKTSVHFFMPTPAGSFQIGRWFQGQVVDITSALLGPINDEAVDFAVRGVGRSREVRARPRGVGRRFSLPMIQRGTLPVIGGSRTLFDVLDRIGASTHVVFWPEATLAGGGPAVHQRLLYGLFEKDLSVAHAGADEFTATPVLYETR